MPGHVDEPRWNAAKKAVAHQYHLSERDGDRYWRLVQSVYQRMESHSGSGKPTQKSLHDAKLNKALTLLKSRHLSQDALIEELADAIHNIWMGWAVHAAESVDNKPRKRWNAMMMPYDDLPDDEKQKDRVEAMALLDIARESATKKSQAGIIGLVLAKSKLSDDLHQRVREGQAHWVTVKEGPLEGRHLLIDGARPEKGSQSHGKILAGHGIPAHVIEKITGATHAHHLAHEVSNGPRDDLSVKREAHAVARAQYVEAFKYSLPDAKDRLTQLERLHPKFTDVQQKKVDTVRATIKQAESLTQGAGHASEEEVKRLSNALDGAGPQLQALLVAAQKPQEPTVPKDVDDRHSSTSNNTFHVWNRKSFFGPNRDEYEYQPMTGKRVALGHEFEGFVHRGAGKGWEVSELDTGRLLVAPDLHGSPLSQKEAISAAKAYVDQHHEKMRDVWEKHIRDYGRSPSAQVLRQPPVTKSHQHVGRHPNGRFVPKDHPDAWQGDVHRWRKQMGQIGFLSADRQRVSETEPDGLDVDGQETAASPPRPFPYDVPNRTDAPTSMAASQAGKREPLTSAERSQIKQRFGVVGCSFAQDKQGIYAYTHRARSASYPHVLAMPKSVVKWIVSTG